jgi:subtilisin family serine protease
MQKGSPKKKSKRVSRLPQACEEEQMRLAKLLLSTTLLIVLISGFAVAGEIHSALAHKLDITPLDETISVIVTMSEQAPINEMNRELRLQDTSRQDRHLQVVQALQETSRSQEPLIAWLDNADRQNGVAGYKSYWIANLLVVSATPEVILAMADRADVAYIENNFTVELIEPVTSPDLGLETGDRGIGVTPGLRAIRAPEVWYDLGITGEGVLLADLDTGVDGNHPALSSRWRGNHEPWQECWLDVLGTGTSFPVDNNNHGTHVMGTMTGLAPDDSIGVAPGAEWIACNAIDQGVSSEFDNDVIDAFEWFADPDGDPFTSDDVPDVVQNSWRINEGFGGDYTDCDTRWWAVIDNCEAAGVVTTWSAGNEGSSSETIGSPADRATSAFNAFSVGAVDATNDPTFPYNIASFSSRGPTGCDVAPDLKIKPEICAPGVDVYSSVPGGGYNGSYSGTSMSGPHVAGVVALMRGANPDLDVDTIKLIIMETARDQGAVGDDNIYGHGFIDAYEAVLASMSGYGAIEGRVYNSSWGNLPLPGVSVTLLGTSHDWQTDMTGFYAGAAAADLYTAEASLEGFVSQQTSVNLVADNLVIQDFYLVDNGGPVISNVTYPTFTNDVYGPYHISADVADFSTVSSVSLYYKVNHGVWNTIPMTGGPLAYGADIPGAPAHSTLEFYIEATDGLSLSSTSPAGAPTDLYSFFITEQVYAFDGEAGQGDWTLGAAGDAASSGLWIHADPVGTNYNGVDIQPEDDHTAAPGTICFVTGNANPGDSAGTNDVDNGCTTLLSPIFDLSTAGRAFVSYWRWFGQGGSATDDEFAVDFTTDGFTWLPLERVPGNANSWQQVMLEIADPSDQVQFRFLACDLGSGGLVEATIDDFAIEILRTDMTAVPGDQNPRIWAHQLAPSRPNPFHPADGPTTLNFSLGQDSQTNLQIFDISGRLVRNVASGNLRSGEHTFNWNGKDNQGNSVGSGVYFYRLQTDNSVQSRSLVLVR